MSAWAVGASMFIVPLVGADNSWLFKYHWGDIVYSEFIVAEEDLNNTLSMTPNHLDSFRKVASNILKAPST